MIMGKNTEDHGEWLGSQRYTEKSYGQNHRGSQMVHDKKYAGVLKRFIDMNMMNMQGSWLGSGKDTENG